MPIVEDGAFRTSRLKLAVLTSIAGKGVSAVVQLLAIPLAIDALGTERFGAYAMIAAALNWISIAGITIAPGLTVEIGTARATGGDRARESAALGAALLLSTTLAAALFTAVLVMINVIGIYGLFGSAAHGQFDQMHQGALLAGGLLAGNVLLSVAEGAQAGYQRQHLHNMCLAVGNVATIVMIIAVVRSTPTIPTMVFAVYCAPLLARLISLLLLFVSKPYLAAGIVKPDLPMTRRILSSGSSFFVASIAGFLYQSFSVFWVGRISGAAAATHMSVYVILLNVAGSVLLLFTQSLWPAIQDARIRSEQVWIRSMYAKACTRLLLYFGASASVFAIFGNRLADHWIKTPPSDNPAAQILLGICFLLLAWEHMHYSFMIGMGKFWTAALTLLGSAGLMLLASLILVPTFGVTGMLGAMCLGPLLISAWFLPKHLRQSLQRGAGPA